MSENDKIEPKHGTVDHRLWQFALICNKNFPHPRDWRRFYLFVVYAHQRRVKWDSSDLKRRLRDLGFGEKYAELFSVVYYHIRCSMHMAKTRSPSSSYRGWMRRGGIALT
jgi:hypothetical protein